jgi:hypothetical protein
LKGGDVAAATQANVDAIEKMSGLLNTLLDNNNKKNKGKNKNKNKGKQQQKKKKEKKDPEALKLKAAIKEGGKKAQDLQGMSDMGGVMFFHCVMHDCEGRMDLLQSAMDAMNKEVDPEGDDRKGGAGGLGKFLFSAGDKALIGICHVPAAVEAKGVTAKEWTEEIAKVTNAKITKCEGAYGYIELLADPDKEVFPLKIRDMATSCGYQFLVTKGVVADDSSSGENAACDFDW